MRMFRNGPLLGGVVLMAMMVFHPHPESRAQAPGAVLTARDLVGMSGPELEALYRGGAAVGLPAGRVRGTALPAPGSRRNGAMSAGARLVWQGKTIDPSGASATNRFFGLPMIRGQLYQGQSWLDGGPAVILDYAETSRVYAQNRDEIRQIAPGLYLGLMYGRTEPQPTLKLYFVLEAGD